jgi:hypothetical protein
VPLISTALGALQPASTSIDDENLTLSMEPVYGDRRQPTCADMLSTLPTHLAEPKGDRITAVLQQRLVDLLIQGAAAPAKHAGSWLIPRQLYS